MDQDVTWYGVDLVAGDIVLDGGPAAPENGYSPHFSADVYCGHTVAHLSYCCALVTFGVFLYVFGTAKALE